MNKYWPYEPSIHLNLAIANLFMQTHEKFLHINNITIQETALDILDAKSRQYLFSEVLIQLEALILDAIELDLNIQHMKRLQNQALYHCTHKSMKEFIRKFKLKDGMYSIDFYSRYTQLFFHEHSEAISSLLTYLIFGCSKIDSNIFAFCKTKTPSYHVKALLENAILQISNFIAFNLAENYRLVDIVNRSEFNQVYNLKQSSIRNLLNFRNNLITGAWLNFYINYPQSIYCGQYHILLLSSQGIIQKKIYINRASSYLQLSNLQLSSIIYLELQDFIIPKTNKLITLIGKLIMYILSRLINKSIGIYFNKTT